MAKSCRNWGMSQVEHPHWLTIVATLADWAEWAGGADEQVEAVEKSEVLDENAFGARQRSTQERLSSS